MKKKQLRAKDVIAQTADFNVEISKKDKVELYDDKIIAINNEPTFFYYENKLLPTLKYLLKNQVLKAITVDMGAVKFVTNGADIMRPGITNIQEDIEENEAIAIIEETHKKPLAVGIALKNTEEMQKVSSGKVIKNIHYIGDEIWQY